MGRFARAGAMVGALALAASLALTGCGDEQKKPAFVGGTSAGIDRRRPTRRRPRRQARRARRAAPALTVSPADGAKNRPVSTEISAKLPDGGKVSLVTLTAAGGGAVKGELRTRRLRLGAVRPAEVRRRVTPPRSPRPAPTARPARAPARSPRWPSRSR